MAANLKRNLLALIGASASAGVVTSGVLALWSMSNATWSSSGLALSTLLLMAISAVACFVGASTIGLAWHTLAQSSGWTNPHVYWAPGAVVGALIPLFFLVSGLIANGGTDTIASSLTQILAVLGAGYGGLTGLFAWLIRRPDRDAANPVRAA